MLREREQGAFETTTPSQTQRPPPRSGAQGLLEAQFEDGKACVNT